MGSSNPDFKVYVAGRPLADDVVTAVIQITVDDSVGAAAVATIKLRDDGCKISDEGPFKCGAPIKVDLGLVGSTQTVFVGEVTGLRAAFPRRGNQTLLVIAQDKFHRLRRNRRQKTYLNTKDSDAVSQAAQAAGLTAQADATPITQESILQWNQTDADFVLERASLFGFEAFVDDGKLIFREPKLTDSEAVTIEWHQALKHFTTSISLHQQQKELKVRAWSMKDKEMLEFSAATGDERDLMGGTVAGAQAVEEVDGAPNAEHTTPASTPEEVEAYAKALFTKRAERFVLGEGTCDGEPKIRRGKVIKIDGIGQMLSGNYYVHRAIHTLLPGTGYTTTFRVYRAGVLAPAEAPPTYERQEVEREPAEAAAEGGPVAFEVATPSGAPLGGAPFVLQDPSGNRQAGQLSSDGRVDVEFEE